VGIPFSMLGVRYRITNDVFQEDLEDTTGLLINETGDTLDTATASQTTNCLDLTSTEKERTRR
jgi:hypothetical protein